MNEESAEDLVWKTVNPNDIWVMDKLILSRKLGYRCGPTGLDVPEPAYYIVRPCVNMLGLGLGTQLYFLEKDTTHLPVGHFWCEIFYGRHLSIDYHWGKQVLAVEGKRELDSFLRWDEWIKTDDVVPYPKILETLVDRYEWINCEFIGSKLIEIHLRQNKDFRNGISHFIPVWIGQSTTPPPGYTYRPYPDVHGRIGAFVK